VANLHHSGRLANMMELASQGPNDEAAMEFGLRIGSLGNIRTTTTLKTFTEEEIGRVIRKLT